MWSSQDLVETLPPRFVGVVRQYSDGRANHRANEHVAAERHVRPSDDVDDSIAHERT